MQPVDTVSFDPHSEPLFWIGPAVVEPPLHQVRLDGTTHKLEPRVMRVLLCLAARPGRPVTRKELLDTVWTEAFPNDEGLTQTVCKLRKAFGDRATRSTVIETIPKVGYRLIAPVSAQPFATNGQANTSTNEQAHHREESRDHRSAPPRPPLPASTFGFGYRMAEWRWLAVCFALLIAFCALWLSYTAPPSVPAEHQDASIYRVEAAPEATTPHRKVRIRVRIAEAPTSSD